MTPRQPRWTRAAWNTSAFLHSEHSRRDPSAVSRVSATTWRGEKSQASEARWAVPVHFRQSPCLLFVLGSEARDPLSREGHRHLATGDFLGGVYSHSLKGVPVFGEGERGHGESEAMSERHQPSAGRGEPSTARGSMRPRGLVLTPMRRSSCGPHSRGPASLSPAQSRSKMRLGSKEPRGPRRKCPAKARGGSASIRGKTSPAVPVRTAQGPGSPAAFSQPVAPPAHHLSHRTQSPLLGHTQPETPGFLQRGGCSLETDG